MLILAAIAGVSAATCIYSVENVIDRKVTNKIAEKKAEKAAAEAAAVCESQPVQPVAAQQPTPSAREAELEQQLAAMQAALAQIQAAQVAQATAPAPAAPAAQPEIPTVIVEQLPESTFKVGQKVLLSDTAQLVEGSLADTDVRAGVVRKINTDGTVRVGLNLGGKKGVRMVTLSEYDLCPAE